VNYDFGVESRFNDVRIEEVDSMPKFCQPADCFANVIIDIAQAAEALEAEIENPERLISNDRRS